MNNLFGGDVGPEDGTQGIAYEGKCCTLSHILSTKQKSQNTAV